MIPIDALKWYNSKENIGCLKHVIDLFQDGSESTGKEL